MGSVEHRVAGAQAHRAFKCLDGLLSLTGIVAHPPGVLERHSVILVEGDDPLNGSQALLELPAQERNRVTARPQRVRVFLTLEDGKAAQCKTALLLNFTIHGPVLRHAQCRGPSPKS